jgi:hypothetical protein
MPDVANSGTLSRLAFVVALGWGDLISVQAECVDPSTLVRSTASITRYFDDGEQKQVRSAYAAPLGSSRRRRWSPQNMSQRPCG